MKKAFTMIELIFVIVVIGILSSVAVPMFSATRDDALVTAEIASLKQNIQNLKTEYASKGKSYTNYPTLYANTNCFRVLLWVGSYGGVSSVMLYYSPYDVSHTGMSNSTCGSFSQSTRDMIYNGAVRANLLTNITSAHNEVLSKRRLSF